MSIAVEIAPFPVIELLFSQGGSIEKGQLMHHAAYRSSADRLDVLAYIFGKGAPINNVMYENHFESYELQKQLAIATPLHIAASTGKLDVVRWLLEHGANPLIKDSFGETPQERALAAGKTEIAEYLEPIEASAAEPMEQFIDGRQAERGRPVAEEWIVRWKAETMSCSFRDRIASVGLQICLSH